MRQHYVLIELEAEDITTADVLGAVRTGVFGELGGPDTGKKRIKALTGNQRLLRYKADRYDTITANLGRWKAGELAESPSV